MLRVGITGGMGSGKSTISRIFQLLEVPVYFADDMARKLMQEDPVLRAKIKAIFGDAAYDEKGLNRSLIASEAFNNPGVLSSLNEAVHPVVIQHGNEWMQQQHAPYTLKEAALIFESDSYKQLDIVIGVFAPKTIRIKRIMNRDGLSEASIEARMSKQMDEEVKMKRCNYVIVNDETKPVIPQVLHLHALLLDKAL